MTTSPDLEPLHLAVRRRDGVCPSCRHQAGDAPGGSLRLHRLLGLPVRPAKCGFRDYDDDHGQSLGGWPCVCDHAFHGS